MSMKQIDEWLTILRPLQQYFSHIKGWQVDDKMEPWLECALYGTFSKVYIWQYSYLLKK